MRPRFAWHQGSAGSASSAASASVRSSPTTAAGSSECDTPASTANWSPRAAPPPFGIMVAASQLSTEEASPIVAMREKRAARRLYAVMGAQNLPGPEDEDDHEGER